jgi:hypothetical protein
MYERHAAIWKCCWVSVGGPTGVRASRARQPALITALAIERLFAREKYARIQLLGLLSAAADVARSGRSAKKQRQQRQGETRALPREAPKKWLQIAHGSTS